MRDYCCILKPDANENPYGVTASGHPYRPNGIGKFIMELEPVDEKNILKVKEIDKLDQTPLIDIKIRWSSGEWLR